MTEKMIVNGLPKPPVERRSAFEGGRPFVHPNGKACSYRDDRWIIETEPVQQSISFKNLPTWVVTYAKRATAQEWLEDSRSTSGVVHMPTNLRGALRILKKVAPNLSSLEHLSVTVAEAFQNEVTLQWRAKRKAASTLSAYVHAINKVLDAAANDGLSIRIRLQLPKEVADSLDSRRGIGRANPEKVLSHEVHVALVRACDQDIQAYDDLRAEIDAAFAGADWSLATPLQRERIIKWFGLEGNRLHKAHELGITGAYVHLKYPMTQMFGEKEFKRIYNLRTPLLRSLPRAIKACAFKLQLCVARRIAAVLELPLDVPTKVETLLGSPRLFIQFIRHKVDGERGVEEWVQCPAGAYSEWTHAALHDARRLSAEVRHIAPEAIRDRLFIVPNGGWRSVTRLHATNFGTYVRNNQPNRLSDFGLLRRVNVAELLGRALTEEEEQDVIDSLENFVPHWVRHTHWTTIQSAIGIPRVAAEYSGHGVQMGLTFYMSGGSDVARESAARAIELGFGTGTVFDAIKLLFTLEKGGDISGIDLGLTTEAAIHRIQTADIGDIFLPHRLTAKEIVDRYEQTGIIMSLVAHGGCLLGADLASCPSPGQDCSIGIDEEANEACPGLGCRYRVLLPHSVIQLERDIENLEEQIEEFSRRNLPLGKLKVARRLEGKRIELERAKRIRDKAEAAERSSEAPCR